MGFTPEIEAEFEQNFPGRNRGKTNPLNNNDLTGFVKL